jgi:hypothetical protein
MLQGVVVTQQAALELLCAFLRVGEGRLILKQAAANGRGARASISYRCMQATDSMPWVGSCIQKWSCGMRAWLVLS